jgi:hypothetical protein
MSITNMLLLCSGTTVFKPIQQTVTTTHLLAVVAAAVVALCCHDGLDGMENVVLVNVAQRVSQAREGLSTPAKVTKE